MKYFDYAATTPVDTEVLDTYVQVSHNFFGNTSSLHKLGRESNYMYEVAKKTIEDTLQLAHHDLIFTSNATEANNLAILGIAKKCTGGKIITTKIEHPSVYNPIQSLEKDFEVKYLDVDEMGQISTDQLEKEMTTDTLLVSIMWVNNIVGTIQNIKRVIEIVKKYPRCKLHVDAVQGMCKIVPDFDFNDIDLFTFSTHKIYGPKGIGVLCKKSTIELSKLLYGSSVQYGAKPGTFDVALIAATAKAIKKFYPLTYQHSQYVKALWTELYNGIKDNKNIEINTPIKGISYYIMNISIVGVKGETVLHKLEAAEICISTGSACSSKVKKPEKTVYAMTKSTQRAFDSVRISLSHLVKQTEMADLIKILREL